MCLGATELAVVTFRSQAAFPQPGSEGFSHEEGREYEVARISHRFLLNGYHWLDNKELWGSAKYGLSLLWCSAETSKRQAREAVLSLRSAWSRARARSRRGSRSALPRIASRTCETSGVAGPTTERSVCPIDSSLNFNRTFSHCRTSHRFSNCKMSLRSVVRFPGWGQPLRPIASSLDPPSEMAIRRLHDADFGRPIVPPFFESKSPGSPNRIDLGSGKGVAVLSIALLPLQIGANPAHASLPLVNA